MRLMLHHEPLLPLRVMATGFFIEPGTLLVRKSTAMARTWMVWKTRDTRRVLPHTCFSVEPGIYLAGDFGVRSEVDVYVTQDEAIVTGDPVQTEVVPILK